jgi:uncharacterized DUF497 family protein
MRIIWDEQKNEWLKNQRKISFEAVCEKIKNGDVLEILENPSLKYPHQGVFVISVNDYTWFVPFVDDGYEIKLITAYPSRKAHKKYGGKSDGKSH